MKIRYLAGVGGLCAVLLLLWYARDTGLILQKSDPAALVPQNALVFVEQKNIGGLIDGFRSSRLGKTFAAFDVERIAGDIGLAADKAEELAQTVRVIEDFGSSSLFREFCGKSLALALLPLDPPSSPEASGEKTDLPFRLLVIAKPQHKAEFLELISSAYSGKVRQSESRYGNSTIRKIETDDVTFFVSTVDGFFLFSLEEKTLHAAIDVSSQTKKSLARMQAFGELKKQFSNPDFFVFTSFEELRRDLSLTAGVDSPARKIAEQFAATAGLQHSVYGIWREKGLFKDKSVTLIDRKNLDPVVKQMLSVAPEHNETLRLVPEDILTYYWSNTFAPGSMWKMYREKNKADADALAGFTKQFKDVTGSDVEKVLALVEGGVSLFIKKGDENAFIPLPHFAVLLKLKDRKEMEEVVKRSVAKFGIPLQENTYKKVTYTSYGLTLPGGLQALYGFHENFLFFANSQQILEDIVDTMESGKGFQQSEEYPRLGMDLENGNNSVCFIRMLGLIDGIKELVGWGGTMLAIQNREAAEKSKRLIDGVIGPLLDGMTMFSSIGTSSRLTEDRIVVESTIELTPEPPAKKEK
jgi:hypothetical protein